MKTPSHKGLGAAAAQVLGHWKRDHRKTAACFDFLEAHFSRGGARSARTDFVASLVDEFIDAPDDFHHILERKAWRRAVARRSSDGNDAEALNIDTHHAAVRAARERLVSEIHTPSDQERAGLRRAVADYATRARNAIEADERVLFPMLGRFLTRDDWRELADELRAYQTIFDRLAPERIGPAVDMRQ